MKAQKVRYDIAEFRSSDRPRMEIWRNLHFDIVEQCVLFKRRIVRSLK